MTKDELRSRVPGYWLERADEAIAAADLAAGNNLLVSAVNRTYYAVFYAACALLSKDGKEYGKHSAVRAAVHRDLVKPGRIAAEYGELYSTLFEERNEGDYVTFKDFSQTDVATWLAKAREFLAIAKRMVT